MGGGSKSKTPSGRWNLQAPVGRRRLQTAMSLRTTTVGKNTTPTRLTETTLDLGAADPGAAAGRAAPEATWPTDSRGDRRPAGDRDHYQRGRPRMVGIVREGNARSRPGARGFAGGEPDRHGRLVTRQCGEYGQ